MNTGKYTVMIQMDWKSPQIGIDPFNLTSYGEGITHFNPINDIENE